MADKIFDEQRYLGDGAFVESAGYGRAIRLYTSDGVTRTNEITLDEVELRALGLFRDALGRAVTKRYAKGGV